MAIRIVDGVLGAGKTYYIVHWLVSNYCLPLKRGGYVLDPARKVRIVTNIDGLKLPHEGFQAALDKAGGFESFFTRSHQESFAADYHLIYILDEAQQWFRPKYCKLTHENLLYFEWSRHLGHDIWLISQSEKKIVSEVACLSEMVVSAQPRTLNIANELTYSSHTVEGVQLGVERLVYSRKVGALYQSAKRKESVKIKNPLARRFFAALVIASLIMFYGCWRTYSWWHGRRVELAAKTHQAESKTPLPAVAGPSSKPAVPAPNGLLSPPSNPASILASSFSSQPAAPQVDYYMWTLDYMRTGRKIFLLLGNTWIPLDQFPYKVVKKGRSFFALVPSVLVPALESGSRAFPLRSGGSAAPEVLK